MLFFRKEIKIKNLTGYKNGIDDSGNEFITIFNDKNKKIATLKINVYANLPEFIIALNCKNIGNEFTLLQKIIMKIKNKARVDYDSGFIFEYRNLFFQKRQKIVGKRKRTLFLFAKIRTL